MFYLDVDDDSSGEASNYISRGLGLADIGLQPRL